MYSHLPTRLHHHHHIPTQSDCKRKYSSATDVFSFGVTLFEMIAGCKPWAELGNMEVPHRVLSGRRPPIHAAVEQWGLNTRTRMAGKAQPATDEEKRVLVNVVEACWRQNPAGRPNMKIVLDRLTFCLELCESGGQQAGAASCPQGEPEKIRRSSAAELANAYYDEISAPGDSRGSAGSSAAYIDLEVDDPVPESVQLRQRSSPRPGLVISVGDGRMEIESPNSYILKDDVLKPSGFVWDARRRVWWRECTSPGDADQMEAALREKLTGRSIEVSTVGLTI